MAALTEYRDIWARKPALRAVYNDIYDRISAQMRPGSAFEIGGGSGNLKERRPDTVSTDIQFAPWLDAVCDAQRMPFPAEQFDNVVMVDVLHHIESPVRALLEIQRVLKPGGRLIFCEPAITPLSAVFYHLFHPEPFDLSADPLVEGPISSGKDPWDSNEAIPTLLVARHRERLAGLLPQLRLQRVDWFSFVAYPLSGGFRPWSMIPRPFVKPLLSAEWAVRKALGRVAAFRLLAVYQKAH